MGVNDLYAALFERLNQLMGSNLFSPDISMEFGALYPQLAATGQGAQNLYLQALASRGLGSSGLGTSVAQNIAMQTQSAASNLAAKLQMAKEAQARQGLLQALSLYLQGIGGLGQYQLGKEQIRMRKEAAKGSMLGKLFGTAASVIAGILTGQPELIALGVGQMLTNDFNPWETG